LIKDPNAAKLTEPWLSITFVLQPDSNATAMPGDSSANIPLKTDENGPSCVPCFDNIWLAGGENRYFSPFWYDLGYWGDRYDF
jgi:hypothetical protein